MKKRLILLIPLLGLFFLMPFMSFSVAAPTYIGVQVGEQYSWTVRVNVNTFTKYAEDLNETLPAEVDMFDMVDSITVKGTISAITDEYTDVYNYALVNMTLVASIPGDGEEPLYPYDVSIFVLNNATNYYFNDTMNAMGVVSPPSWVMAGFPFLIVPYNLNWTVQAAGLQATIEGFTGGLTGISIVASGNGFKLTIPAQNIEGNDMKEMAFYAQWNSKGVFAQGEMTYEGASMMSVNVSPEEAIPGYELPIMLGITAIGSIGLIIYIRKKN